MSMHPDPVGDLEYNLQQYHKLLEPMLADKADAAIGLRLCAEDPLGFLSTSPATDF